MNLAAQPAPRNYPPLQHARNPTQIPTSSSDKRASSAPGLSPHLSMDLVYASSPTSGPTCQPSPWLCPTQHPPPPSQPGARSEGHRQGRGGGGGLARYHSSPAVITYPAASGTVMSTLCAQGTCLSLKINMTKPLSSFFLLSLQSESPASHLQRAARCFPCAFCEALLAMASLLPSRRESLAPGMPGSGAPPPPSALTGHGVPVGWVEQPVTWRPSLSGSPARAVSRAEEEPS